MTPHDFTLFANTLRCPDVGTEQGYYPAMRWNDSIARLWFKTLQRFPAAKVMRALELHVHADPRPRPHAGRLPA